jgi:lactate dehydrogenase-like 2-hydroxyacid dehydrogenase
VTNQSDHRDKSSLLVVSPIPRTVADRISRDYDAVLSQDRSLTVDETTAAATAHRVDALLVSTRVKLSAQAIAALPASVKIIATYSVGYDHIDIAAAAARGIVVTNTPEVLTDATADLTILLMLAASRNMHQYSAIMEKGWRQKFGLHEMLGIQAGGKTLGILGFGRIGQAVAKRARAFGMRIIYHDTVRRPAEIEDGAEYYGDFRSMLPHCDFLSLHAPSAPGAPPVMNREMFALLPTGAVFVNAARGQLVDEDALIDALTSGHLFAAGLDVFQIEPDYDLRFRDLPNVILTPHMGSATRETRDAMGFRALANIEAVLSGRPAPDAVSSRS